MRTVRLPLHCWTIEVIGTQQIDLATGRAIGFEFAAVPTGEIEIDSVEFTD